MAATTSPAPDRLAAALGRDRAKDMATDYGTGRDNAEQLAPFAERRGISLPKRVRELVREAREQAKSVFASFRPKSVERVERIELTRTSSPPDSDPSRAIEHYARAMADIGRMRANDLPVLPHQQTALAKASDALNRIRPEAARDLGAAFDRNPGLVAEAARGRTAAALRAMQVEAEIRVDPNLRADRFVSDWQKLARQREVLGEAGQEGRATAIGRRMESMAGGLQRDAQLESLLRQRTRELGISLDHRLSLPQQLAWSIEPTRSRSLGISM